MEAITFVVPAIPIAQPRPKARAFAGHAQIYEADKSHPVHAFKASVRHAAAEAYQGAPLECPLYVSLLFVFPRPANKRWKKRPMPREWCPKKPDCDNLIKSCLDAMNGLTFADDSQVVAMDLTKFVAAGDEQPHVVVRIREALSIAESCGF